MSEKNSIESEDAFETLTLEMLPELTERFLEQARDDRLVNWALGIFDAYPHGMIHMDEQGGYLLQILHPNTIRVIQIFDNFGCFSNLQMLHTTCEKADIELEIEGYAHITPKPDQEQVDTREMARGMGDDEFDLGIVGGDLPPVRGMRNMPQNPRAPEEMWV
jgi:hypothetical protein